MVPLPLPLAHLLPPLSGFAEAGEGWERLPRAPPRPASGPPSQEARKEPPGAMDGAVMEGPLFLQSQRFGAKVVWAGVTEPHPSWRWATEPKRREGARGG